MDNAIRILHISDFHARASDEVYLEQRVTALFNDLAQMEQGIDVVAFTGDLAYYGTKEDYEIADRLLIQPLKKRIRKGNKPVPIVMVPGNHDVDRSVIGLVDENRLRKNLIDSATAFAALHDASNLARLQNYYSYMAANNMMTEPNFTISLNVKGTSIGVACFNTAWRCSGDDDKEHLFITEEQVHTAVREVEEADIKIALLHHPFQWLHREEERGSVDDIKRSFDLVLTGHLHEQDSHGDITPAAECLLFAAPALCDGKSPQAGYNIYTIFFEQKQVHGQYRKFVRRRQEFDKDIDFAKNGEKEYPLPINDLVKYSQGILCQRLSKAATGLEEKLKKSLNVYQRKVDPIYVTPPLQTVTWNKGKKESEYLKSDFASLANDNSLIYGAPETGKTNLLCAIGSTINSNSSKRRQGHLAIYHDLNDKIGNQLEKQIKRTLDETLENEAGASRLTKLTILLDHANKKLPDVLKLIPSLVLSNPKWNFIITTSNEVEYDAYAASVDGKDWLFYKLAFWGPSRIREFVGKFFGDNTVDIDAAFAFVSNSLREADLPAIPLIVILYLNVFRVTGNRFSSLSFLELLMKFEAMRFEDESHGSGVSTYNKERLLATLAAECFKQKNDVLLMSEVKALIELYFKTKGLPFNIDALIAELIATGLVETSGELFAFRYFVFNDYYLARALQVKLVTIEEASTNLQESLRVANALALYGGLIRENLELAIRLLDHIEENFKPVSEWKLNDLDTHIQGRLMPDFTEQEADQVTADALEKRVDYSQSDEKFHQDKEQQIVKRREESSKKTPTDINVFVLSGSLKAFYNIFRNLENIDLSDKARLLERILDFHVHFNIELIDYFMAKNENADISSIFGYCVTLAGQAFMSANLSNQTLKEAIEEAIKNCKNDFKEMLLLFLYADLRLPAYELKLEQFCKKTASKCAVEMIFFKLYSIMVHYDKPKHPTALASAFRAALKRRAELWDTDMPQKAQARYLDIMVGNVQKQNTIHHADQKKN